MIFTHILKSHSHLDSLTPFKLTQRFVINLTFLICGIEVSFNLLRGIETLLPILSTISLCCYLRLHKIDLPTFIRSLIEE